MQAILIIRIIEHTVREFAMFREPILFHTIYNIIYTLIYNNT
jgi:hypothetical protein